MKTISTAIKNNSNVDPAELSDELELTIGVYVLALAKLTAQHTNQRRGEMVCPRCLTGRLVWSIAPNGHGRVVCDRVVGHRADGQSLFCVAVME